MYLAVIIVDDTTNSARHLGDIIGTSQFVNEMVQCVGREISSELLDLCQQSFFHLNRPFERCLWRSSIGRGLNNRHWNLLFLQGFRINLFSFSFSCKDKINMLLLRQKVFK